MNDDRDGGTGGGRGRGGHSGAARTAAGGVVAIDIRIPAGIDQLSPFAGAAMQACSGRTSAKSNEGKS